jgi:hypothetical protein
MGPGGQAVSVLGVDVGSTRVHVATMHDGRVMPVPAPDGLTYVPSVAAYARGRMVVGASARAHFLVAPNEVLFDPASRLGGEPVPLGPECFAPEEIVARLLESAAAAGQAVAGTPIDGVALSRPAQATSAVRRALAGAATRASLTLVRTEVATTLGAVARHAQSGPIGFAAFVDVGGGKVEAAVLSLEVGGVRALGRSVDATVGGSWLDACLVESIARQVAPHDEGKLLDDRRCCELLREQCEAMRAQLGTQNSVTILLPFLSPVLGIKEPPIWRLDRSTLDALAQPLVEAIEGVCRQALEHAGLPSSQIGEVFVSGGLAHMPLVCNTVSSCFGRPASRRGDVDSVVARGAALVAAASLGQHSLKVIDDLDEGGRSLVASVPVLPPPAPAARHPSQELPRTPPPVIAARRPSQELPRTPPPVVAAPAARRPSQELPRTPPPAPTGRPSQETPRTPAPAAAPSASGVAAAAVPELAPRGRDQGILTAGPIRNPRDPAALAAIPLEGALPSTPPLSIPVLLLSLGRRRSFSGSLTLRHETREACVAIVRGGAAGTSLDLEQLRRSFEWPEGTYQLKSEPPAQRFLAMRQPMVGVVTHGLRSCLRLMDLDQVVAVLAPHLAQAPRVRPGRAAIVPMLGLSPRELRFVEHVLDGSAAGEEILRRGGIGRETAIHLLFVLHLFRALEWCSVDIRPGESPSDRLRQRALQLEKADHFEVLGVHWSVARADLDHALLRLEEELKPGSPTSQLDAKAAEQILARARRAHQAVADEQARHAYLLEIHPDLDFEAIESVAEDQNQWYAWRGAVAATEESARLKHELLELSRMQHNAPKLPR